MNEAAYLRDKVNPAARALVDAILAAQPMHKRAETVKWIAGMVVQAARMDDPARRRATWSA